MVWSADKESMEPETGFERVVGGERERGCGGMCRICNWDGDTGVHLVAKHAVWNNRFAPYVWVCATNRSDGIELDDGQDRTNLSERGRLRAGDERYLWP